MWRRFTRWSKRQRRITYRIFNSFSLSLLSLGWARQIQESSHGKRSSITPPDQNQFNNPFQLSSRERSDIKVKIIGVVKLVLEKTELRQVHALKTILIVLTKEVYEFQTAQLVPNVSEELIIGVLGCISVANRRASSDSVEQFFQPENASQICQIMYVILLLLDKSDFREIKLKALEALMSLLHVNDGSDLSDIVLRNQISGIIFFAVPMIWTSLSKPILNDPKIGRQVIEVSHRSSSLDI